jgi:hypothetical protein
MLTTIGKCLAVLTAVLALAFAGFVLIGVAGGPNWQAKAAALEEYRFDLSEGETPQWSASYRVGSGETGEAIGSPAQALPQKLVDALNHKKTRLQERIREIDAAIAGDPAQGLAPLAERITEARQTIEADIKALQAYEQRLVADLEQVQAAIDELSRQVVQKTQEAYAKRQEASERREEMYRLRNQWEEVNADIHRTRAQQNRLRDLLNRTYGAIGRLERRTNQLENRTGAGEDDGQYEEQTAASATAVGATAAGPPAPNQNGSAPRDPAGVR